MITLSSTALGLIISGASVFGMILGFVIAALTIRASIHR